MKPWVSQLPRIGAGRSPRYWQQAIAVHVAQLWSYQQHCRWVSAPWLPSLKLNKLPNWDQGLGENLQVERGADAVAQLERSPSVMPLPWSEPGRSSVPPGRSLGANPAPKTLSAAGPWGKRQNWPHPTGPQPPMPVPFAKQALPLSPPSSPSVHPSATEAFGSLSSRPIHSSATEVSAPLSSRSSNYLQQLPAQVDYQHLAQLAHEDAEPTPAPGQSSLASVPKRSRVSTPSPTVPTVAPQQSWFAPAQQVAKRLRSPVNSPPLFPETTDEASQQSPTQGILSQSAVPLTGPTVPVSVLVELLQPSSAPAGRSRPAHAAAPHPPVGKSPTHDVPSTLASVGSGTPPRLPHQPSKLSTGSSPSISTTPTATAMPSASETGHGLNPDSSAASPKHFFSALQQVNPPARTAPAPPQEEVPRLSELLRRSPEQSLPYRPANTIIRRTAPPLEPPNTEGELQYLAAQIKQILDEEARRQGIDV